MIIQPPANTKTDIAKVAFIMEKCFLIDLKLRMKKFNNYVLLPLSLGNNCRLPCARHRCWKGDCVWVGMKMSQIGMVSLPKKPPNYFPYIETKTKSSVN